jgi:hypothetical protein
MVGTGTPDGCFTFDAFPVECCGVANPRPKGKLVCDLDSGLS